MSIPTTFALSIQLVSLFFHPLHVSVTDIRYDEKEKELEIILRIFTDDLEQAIRAQAGKPDMDILNPPAGQTTDKLISRHLAEHLKISLDGKVQPQRFLGHEAEGEALLCYIQVANVKQWKTITIMNDLLMETFDDQSNIVHVTVRGKIKSIRLVPDNPSGQLSFDVQ